MHSSRMRTGRSGGGVSALMGLLRGGVCSGGSAPGGLIWGVSDQGGVCSGGSASGGSALGGFALGGGLVYQHALRQTPPVNRMTNRCKNITLATNSLRPVTTKLTPSIEVCFLWMYGEAYILS